MRVLLPLAWRLGSVGLLGVGDLAGHSLLKLRPPPGGSEVGGRGIGLQKLLPGEETKEASRQHSERRGSP